MKLSLALFFAGIFGALSVLLFLLAFGTDYWLLATERCPSVQNRMESVAAEKGDIIISPHEVGGTFHHEGFFWRCWINGALINNNFWKFWFKMAPKMWEAIKFLSSGQGRYYESAVCTAREAWCVLVKKPFCFKYPPSKPANKPPSKYCTQAYLLPFPLTTEPHNSTVYETAIIYRGFWSVFMLLGVIAAIVGGFIIICAAPFSNYNLYKAGGGLFLSAGVLFTILVIMYVIWIETVIDIQEYIQKQRNHLCFDFDLSIQYGWSFILAPIGIFFSLLAGLLFLLAGHAIQVHYD